MISGLCTVDGRGVDNPALWWGGRNVEELGDASQAPWAAEGFCLVSLGMNAGHPYSRVRRRQPEG